MNIKVASINSALHKEILSYSTIFLKDIFGEEIPFTTLDDYDCDLKLIYVETGGSEGLFLENLEVLEEPYYLLTSGANNSLAASLEIMTYIKAHNRKGEILHGSTNYLKKRIEELAKIEHAKKELSKTRLGVFGKPSDWLIASVPEEGFLKERFGINLVNISIDELYQEFLMQKIKSALSGFNADELLKAEKMDSAIATLLEKYKLDGFTIRCFDLLTKANTTSCYALAKLNADGYTATCEGDIMAMITMRIVRLLTGQSVFQANPSRFDIEKNELVLAHCTIPLDMVEDYHFDTHFESGIGVAIKGELSTKEVTITRMNTKGEFSCVTGRIVENLNESNLCRTQIRVILDEPFDLLTHPYGNHQIVCYGNHKELITKFLEMK